MSKAKVLTTAVLAMANTILPKPRSGIFEDRDEDL